MGSLILNYVFMIEELFYQNLPKEEIEVLFEIDCIMQNNMKFVQVNFDVEESHVKYFS